MNIPHLVQTALGQILKGELPAAATCWSLLVVKADLLPPSCSISHFVLVISPTHDHSALTLVGQAGNIDKTIICLPFIWFSISITDWRRQKEKIAASIFFSYLTTGRRRALMGCFSDMEHGKEKCLPALGVLLLFGWCHGFKHYRLNLAYSTQPINSCFKAKITPRFCIFKFF